MSIELLKSKIHSFLNSEISLLEFEDFISSIVDTSNDSKMLGEILHAVEHYDSDFLNLEHDEKTAMRHKLSKIADSLTENRDNTEKLLSDFFNNPYQK